MRKEPNSFSKAKYLRGGFTLTEVLAVVAILAVLAAILFPVFASSRRNAFETQDASNLRQTYASVVLYEQDHDSVSPDNLAVVSVRYLDSKMLYSRLDPRGSGNGPVWPVNVFCTPNLDGDFGSKTSGIPISFAYLKPFQTRFHPGDTWDTYRNDPKVGMLTDTTLQFNDEPQFGHVEGIPNQPAYNYRKFFVCRMDGSIAIRHVPEDCAGDTYEDLFLFWPIECQKTASSPM